MNFEMDDFQSTVQYLDSDSEDDSNIDEYSDDDSDVTMEVKTFFFIC